MEGPETHCLCLIAGIRGPTSQLHIFLGTEIAWELVYEKHCHGAGKPDHPSDSVCNSEHQVDQEGQKHRLSLPGNRNSCSDHCTVVSFLLDLCEFERAL